MTFYERIKSGAEVKVFDPSAMLAKNVGILNTLWKVVSISDKFINCDSLVSVRNDRGERREVAAVWLVSPQLTFTLDKTGEVTF